MAPRFRPLFLPALLSSWLLLLVVATIGGSASDFDVVQLADRVFRFSVSSKLVGFHIVKLKSFESSCFKIFFHLRSNGGPRWELEFANYCKEEASSWSEIRRSSSSPQQQPPSIASKNFVRQRSFAEAVKLGHLTGANAIPMRVSAFNRLEFPNNFRHSEATDQQQIHSDHAKSSSSFSQAGNGGVNRAARPKALQVAVMEKETSRSPNGSLKTRIGLLGRGQAAHHDFNPSRIAATVHQENLQQHSALATQSFPAERSDVIMAFQRADPRPFLSRGMTWEDVPNRPLMVRAVTSSRPQPQNENVAIATITPLPGNPLNFAVVREVLREFLEDREHVPLVDIQPCHVGQAYVRFLFGITMIETTMF
ncbi:unnamed protein product [Miscanthus lutarioriparius]|uniref:Uncharacterized protein n=1 Tax=Miscanthus lutarioriparius TaxID=422564 RepID=A0A811P8N9_9POAL|nr:unnamed protein product [Miscanthus lutarioriparius]